VRFEKEHRPYPLENPCAGIGIDISPMPAASWPNACATFAPAGKRTALESRMLINFIVAADVSRLKLPPAGIMSGLTSAATGFTQRSRTIVRRPIEN
jgi:hypothetical protein